MFSISKILRYKLLAKTPAIIILIYKDGKLYTQIGDYLKLEKSTMISIIYYYNR